MTAKLFNITVSFDIYLVANDKESAQSTAMAIIAEGAEPPFDQSTYEMKKLADIPARVRDQNPFISSEIAGDKEPNPEDTVEVWFRRIYGKQP